LLTAADMLGKASLTLGLFAVGASLDLSVARMEIKGVAIASTLKLIATPALCAILCWLLGLDHVARGCALVCAAVPGAASSYILAKQLGGDAPLMSGITTVQTLVAIVTMPLMLWMLL
jgi:predicted permease